MKRSKVKSRPRYGAFELKTKYRRNMILGTMLSAFLAMATTAFAFLFTQSGKQSVVPKSESKLDSIIVTIGPEIIIKPVKPKGRSGPRPPIITDGSKIVPVEDEPIGEEITVRSITDQYFTGPIGDDTIGSGSYIDNPIYGNGYGGQPEYPAPDSLVICELPPEMIYSHQPDYPRLALTAGLEGAVWIKALVDIDGSVRDAMIFISSKANAGFDQEALKAAYKCKYKPGIQNGRPVPVWVSYKVEFVLGGSL